MNNYAQNWIRLGSLARTQHQAFLRPEPRRQARDHPRRAHHDQTRRGPTPTTGPTLVVAGPTGSGADGVGADGVGADGVRPEWRFLKP